jgi:hypothetical protein
MPAETVVKELSTANLHTLLESSTQLGENKAHEVFIDL